MSLKQREIKIKPRIKLNHNIYNVKQIPFISGYLSLVDLLSPISRHLTLVDTPNNNYWIAPIRGHLMGHPFVDTYLPLLDTC